jgi:hypothetical protein
MRTREETWAALDGQFKTLMDCLGQLTEEELTSTPVAGIWTVKDVIAHVWCWVEEAINTARAWQGSRSWQEDVVYDDARNESQVADRSGLPLITVVDGVTGAHRRLMHLLDMASDEELAQVGRAPWGAQMQLVDFFYEMAGHYAEHARDLKEYQERCLEGCD